MSGGRGGDLDTRRTPPPSPSPPPPQPRVWGGDGDGVVVRNHVKEHPRCFPAFGFVL